MATKSVQITSESSSRMTDDRIYELQLVEDDGGRGMCGCVWEIANNSKLKSTVNLTFIGNSAKYQMKLFANMPKIPKIYQSIPSW